MAQTASETSPVSDSESSPGFDYHIDQFLELMVENQASDLILKSGSSPALRINGSIETIDMDSLTPKQVRKLAHDFLTVDEINRVIEDRQEFDGAYTASGIGRFRVNAFLQRDTMAMVLRHIQDEILDFDKLNLPKSMKKIPGFERGLVLVTGTTSSGKSSTLASMVDRINQNQKKHIITIEDPIEFMHNDKKSIVTQREVGIDTETFASGIKYVLRQDPDIILLGEMRDRDTVEAAIQAAQTGHLVMSTLHTNTTPQTIDRLIEYFSAEEQSRVRGILSEHLMAIIGQRLLPRSDQNRRVPAVEILFNTPTIKKLIREDRLTALRSAIHQGENEGMQTFDQSIVNLFESGLIDEETARQNCSSPENWPMYKKGQYPDVTSGVLGGLNE